MIEDETVLFCEAIFALHKLILTAEHNNSAVDPVDRY